MAGDIHAERAAALPDRTALLALEEVAHELGRTHPTGLTTAYQAQDVLTALFAQAGADSPPLPPDDPAAAARRVLAVLVREEGARNLVEEVLADPPEDDQMGGDDLVTDLTVLAGVIAFLRLHVTFRFKHDDGRNTVEFGLEKKPLNDGTLAALVRTVLSLMNREP
ncbi:MULTISPECIES: hypothetical protein [unclassified Streptomyces]|uniref:hypothetical protein n=1 Tax=unclassified Streptomyces TaxID=2593676 RepID=UPI00037ED071|nr:MULTISPECIES: hypothetical protein [unclassified Streptomyces]MYY03909.1 hypothetical protein [Streptomyces sp. SID4913]